MTETDPEDYADALASQSLAHGDPVGWFERLYAAAAANETVVPWDRGVPRPALVTWAESHGTDGTGRSAIVVGCGYGQDAEYVASLGYATTAFDVSESAIRDTRRRFPASPVEYRTADLFALPDSWRSAFDLVVESLTVQALPVELHEDAIAAVRTLVAPGGTLLVIAAIGDEDGGQVDGPPWPLLRTEVESFAGDALRPVRVEQVTDPSSSRGSRWRAEFTRPPA